MYIIVPVTLRGKTSNCLLIKLGLLMLLELLKALNKPINKTFIVLSGSEPGIVLCASVT